MQERSRKDLILMMYNCEVNESKDITLNDLGVIMTYISDDYAKRSNIHFLENATSRAVDLPNDNKMKILGYCEFLMKMGD